MRKLLLLIMSFAFCAGVSAQQLYKEGVSKFTVSTDHKTGNVVYRGTVTVADLKKEPTFGWLQRNMKDYKLDSQVIYTLKQRLTPYDIVVFMGTWCDDSHTMIPRLLRVLEAVEYNGNVTIYGVSRDKTTGNEDEKKFKINRIPVVILTKDGKEVGRVTEVIERSMEEDILRQLN
jgi:thiol-disulfide isomerase/thioredoxin